MDNHEQDSHCTVDPKTNLCVTCGALHGEPCYHCGARAYHRPGCLFVFAGHARGEVLNLQRDAAESIRTRPETKKRFPLGQCHATHGAMGALEDNQTFPIVYLKRHQAGDFGEVSEVEKRLNFRAIAQGQFVQSKYRLADGQTIWIKTEADRSKTTILHVNEIWRGNHENDRKENHN